MAVTLADIKKLRDITGAGMMDVKKALEEANGDFEVAKDLLRKRGQAIAAKRSDREASEGCVLAKVKDNFGAIVAVKCETDFVAKNADFVGMVKLILDAALDNKVQDFEALKNLKIGNFTVAEANRLGIPVFGIVDTNSNPNNIDFVIPANDDATKSIDTILAAVSSAIQEGLEERKVEKADESAAEAQTNAEAPAPKERRQRIRKAAPKAEEPKAEEAAE